MSKYGTPVYSPNRECCCFVTIEGPGSNVAVKLWAGTSFKAIRDKCEETYKGSIIQFGRCFWRTK
jgi:hypothetical protein